MTDNCSLVDAMKEVFVSWMKEAIEEALREHESYKIQVYPEKIGIYQASEITGYSRNSLYQMHSRGTIPGALKVGGKLLFDTATLRRWVEEGGHAARNGCM